MKRNTIILEMSLFQETCINLRKMDLEDLLIIVSPSGLGMNISSFFV